MKKDDRDWSEIEAEWEVSKYPLALETAQKAKEEGLEVTVGLIQRSVRVGYNQAVRFLIRITEEEVIKG